MQERMDSNSALKNMDIDGCNLKTAASAGFYLFNSRDNYEIPLQEVAYPSRYNSHSNALTHL